MPRILEPNGYEKHKARTGFYASFEEMPPVVRAWAKRNGCMEVDGRGVRGERHNEGPMEEAVHRILHRFVLRSR